MSPSLISTLALLALAAAPQDAPKSAAIAPFVGEDVAAVVQVDLMRWPGPASLRRVLGKLADDTDVGAVASGLDGWVDALRKAGATDLFLLVDPADMPGYPLAVVPMAPGADGRKVAEILTGGSGLPLHWPKADRTGSAVVAGSFDAMTRLQTLRPVDRPEVLAALGSARDAAVRIALVPTIAQRRAIEESFPTLPPTVGGSPIEAVTRGMRWASLALSSEPNATLRLAVRAKDAESAGRLRDIARSALGLLAASSRTDPSLGVLADAVAGMKPEADGETVRLDADLEKTAGLVSVPILKAREATRRAQCVDNLKQLGLAMHNYHNTFKTFPAAYVAGKDGKPLLSWRVLILPFVEEKELFDQFRMDEPWDGPHNKALIGRMPKVYACPGAKKSLGVEGKTTYLTPRGPDTLFPGATGIKIQEVTDGTSNTIMVVDASDDLATTWTKPDDWSTAPEFKLDGLFGHHPLGTNFTLADGSVRFLKQAITPKLLQCLSTRSAGEMISADDY